MTQEENIQKPVRTTRFFNRLRLIGFTEGVSTLVLFGVAMPLKYLAGMPEAVRIAGSLHGVLFVGLSVMLMMAISRLSIAWSVALVGIIAAVFPFGPFVFDRWLLTKVNISKES